MFVMKNEPALNMSAVDIKDYYADKHIANDLADAYAIAHNQFWWVVDNEYNYEEGSPEHKAACAITNEWGALMKEYQNEIFEMLSKDGVVIPQTCQIKVLEPFMARFGYVDGNGWWIKSQIDNVI